VSWLVLGGRPAAGRNERELAVVDRHLHRQLKDHAGYLAIHTIYGVGPIIASVFVAEIGDIARSPPRGICVRGPA
jgi:hypothetical protein